MALTLIPRKASVARVARAGVAPMLGPEPAAVDPGRVGQSDGESGVMLREDAQVDTPWIVGRTLQGRSREVDHGAALNAARQPVRVAFDETVSTMRELEPEVRIRAADAHAALDQVADLRISAAADGRWDARQGRTRRRRGALIGERVAIPVVVALGLAELAFTYSIMEYLYPQNPEVLNGLAAFGPSAALVILAKLAGITSKRMRDDEAPDPAARRQFSVVVTIAVLVVVALAGLRYYAELKTWEQTAAEAASCAVTPVAPAPTTPTTAATGTGAVGGVDEVPLDLVPETGSTAAVATPCIQPDRPTPLGVMGPLTAIYLGGFTAGAVVSALAYDPAERQERSIVREPLRSHRRAVRQWNTEARRASALAARHRQLQDEAVTLADGMWERVQADIMRYLEGWQFGSRQPLPVGAITPGDPAFVLPPEAAWRTQRVVLDIPQLPAAVLAIPNDPDARKRPLVVPDPAPDPPSDPTGGTGGEPTAADPTTPDPGVPDPASVTVEPPLGADPTTNGRGGPRPSPDQGTTGGGSSQNGQRPEFDLFSDTNPLGWD